MQKRSFICCFIILIVARTISAQKMTITGWVSDSATGENLMGALVHDLTSKNGATTDVFGFFSILSTKNQSCTLRISALGYQTDTITIHTRASTGVKIALAPALLKEVVIKADIIPVQDKIGIVNIPVEQLKTRPMLLGEADLLKALALTPGIKTGTEGTAGLYVRGGTPDQNHILLDGATVYNTSHLFGFLSVFNPDAVKSIALYKGNMPARYGSRLSSVIDVTMKEGNNQHHEQEISAGLISSKALFQGPLQKGRSSYLLSARTSYMGLFALPIRVQFERNSRSDYFNYWMYDINGKVNFDLTAKSRLYASFYTGRDDWKALSRSSDQRYDFGINWGNATGTVRYTNLLYDKLFFISQLSYNRYRYAVDQQFFQESSPKDKDLYANRSYVQDISWRNSGRVSLTSFYQIEAGVDLTAQALAPQSVKFDGGTILEDSLPFVSTQRYRGIIAAAFVENNLTVSKKIMVSAGLRAVSFNTGGTGYHYLEPRTSISFIPSAGTVFQLSWRQNQQFTHLLATSSVGLPNEVWVPATRNTPPSFAEQFSGGISHQLKRPGITLSLEAYHKTMRRLLDYRQGINLITAGQNWEELVVKNGVGRAYGLEFMAHKHQGRFNGWISYTLSRNERRFDGINGGSWYPHRFDRRHEVAVTGNYRLNNKWSAAANFVFSTGDAITAPIYYHIISNNRIVEPFYLGKNTERTPNYHRLDLSLTKNILTRRGRDAYLNFGVYNAYANVNPFYVNIKSVPIIDTASNIKITGFRTKYEVKSIFTFIPSISYGLKF